MGITKVCRGCSEDKPLSGYSAAKKNPDGKSNWCKVCDCASRDAYRKDRKANRPNDYARYRSLNASRIRARTYGVTACQFTRMRIEQNGKCAMCKEPNPDGKQLAVDHRHHECEDSKGNTCGLCTRDLLCDLCNRGLGQFKDSPALLREAAAYIERWESVQQG